MFCIKCGSPHTQEALFCGNCGSRCAVQVGAAANPQRSESSTALEPSALSASPLKNEGGLQNLTSVATPQPSDLTPTTSSSNTGLMGSTVIFVATYLLCMLPTYYLPYVGSNSIIVQGMSAAVNGKSMGTFWVHLAFSFALVGIATCRGPHINKQWLPTLPVMAAFFDLTPGLSSIPLIPTAIHIMAVVFGASGKIDQSYKPTLVRAIATASVFGILLAIGLLRIGQGSTSKSSAAQSDSWSAKSATPSKPPQQMTVHQNSFLFSTSLPELKGVPRNKAEQKIARVSFGHPTHQTEIPLTSYRAQYYLADSKNVETRFKERSTVYAQPTAALGWLEVIKIKTGFIASAELSVGARIFLKDIYFEVNSNQNFQLPASQKPLPVNGSLCGTNPNCNLNSISGRKFSGLPYLNFFGLCEREQKLVEGGDDLGVLAPSFLWSGLEGVGLIADTCPRSLAQGSFKQTSSATGKYSIRFETESGKSYWTQLTAFDSASTDVNALVQNLFRLDYHPTTVPAFRSVRTALLGVYTTEAFFTDCSFGDNYRIGFRDEGGKDVNFGQAMNEASFGKFQVCADDKEGVTANTAFVDKKFKIDWDFHPTSLQSGDDFGQIVMPRILKLQILDGTATSSAHGDLAKLASYQTLQSSSKDQAGLAAPNQPKQAVPQMRDNAIKKSTVVTQVVDQSLKEKAKTPSPVAVASPLSTQSATSDSSSPSWPASLRVALSNCGSESFFQKIACQEKAKWKYCAPDNWGKISECGTQPKSN